MLSYSADQTYTFDDLLAWQYPGTSLAVLGQPVRHSISPQMHNAALRSLCSETPRFADWRYFRFEIRPEQLPEALPIFHSKGFAGLNLTVPHKEIAFPIVKAIDSAAKAIGAVNTLKRLENGYAGYNTDGYGLEQGIDIQLKRSIEGSDFVLLGAGGAARAAAIQALRSGCATLTIINRNQDRLAQLISEISPIASSSGIPLKPLAPQDIGTLPDGCLLINATSLGLKPEDPTPIPVDRLPVGASCFDMIYNPPRTALMHAVTRSGGHAVNGLAMLVHQGAKSLEIWTGKQPPADLMQAAADSALSLR